jgi:hypothetical protein
MQFADLDGLTPLPVEHIEHRFRNEEVITVLPLLGRAGQPSLVVATPSKAAIVVGEVPPSEHWMTYWAPWDTVAFVDNPASEEDIHGLTVLIGRMAFDVQLPGPPGQRALREFVVTVQTHQAPPERMPALG